MQVQGMSNAGVFFHKFANMLSNKLKTGLIDAFGVKCFGGPLDSTSCSQLALLGPARTHPDTVVCQIIGLDTMISGVLLGL